MDKISVIVPVYKVEQYLNKCVDSIICQTYKNLEIILVDDGSPDRCGEICDEYAKKDDRVKVIHKKNGGLSDARNAGLDISTGDWIGFVDSDDYINPDMYEKLLCSAKENDADISLCSYKYVGDGEYDNNSPVKTEVISGKDILFRKMNQKKSYYWVVAWNKLYKSHLFNEIRYPYGKLHEDEFTIHEIFYGVKKVACVSESLYNYLQRDNSIVNSNYSVRHLDLAEAQLNRAEFLYKNLCENSKVCSIMISGIFTAVRRYKECKGQDGAKNRFDELVSKYRKLVKNVPFKGVPLSKKLCAYLIYIFPYYCGYLIWKVNKFINRNRGEKVA